jgi:proteasome lid subunit RPN8/RPN11
MDQDLPIELDEVSAGERTLSRLRPAPPEYLVGQVGRPGPQAREVYAHLGCVATILEQVARTPLVEVGGLLAGQSCRDEQGLWLDVQAALPATSATGSRISLTFTQEAWSEMLGALESRLPGGEVLGWYHTHPGLGVFLSAQDLFIQRSFFTAPHHVALVIDPRRFAWTPFLWEQEELRPARRLMIYAQEGESFPQLAAALPEGPDSGDIWQAMRQALDAD